MYLFPKILIYKSSIKTSVDFESFDISLSFFVMRNFRGTRSSVEMLKGHMVRERLGTSALTDELE